MKMEDDDSGAALGVTCGFLPRSLRQGNLTGCTGALWKAM